MQSIVLISIIISIHLQIYLFLNVFVFFLFSDCIFFFNFMHLIFLHVTSASSNWINKKKSVIHSLYRSNFCGWPGLTLVPIKYMQINYILYGINCTEHTHLNYFNKKKHFYDLSRTWTYNHVSYQRFEYLLILNSYVQYDYYYKGRCIFIHVWIDKSIPQWILLNANWLNIVRELCQVRQVNVGYPEDIDTCSTNLSYQVFLSFAYFLWID